MNATGGRNRAFLAALALLAGACVTGGPKEAGTPGDARIERSVRALLKPWHEFKPEWMAKSSAIVLVTMGPKDWYLTSPGDVSSEIVMPAFPVERVLKSNVRCAEIRFWDALLPRLAEPHYVDYGRRYLLFLALDAKDAAAFARRQKEGYVSRADKIVATLDLDRSEQEHLIGIAEPMITVRYGDFEFSPALWKKVREAETVDYALQARVIDFLENVVLVEGRTALGVSAYLGRADAMYGSSFFLYSINLSVPPEGEGKPTWTYLSIRFHPDGTIESYQIYTLGATRKTHNVITNRPSADELAALGLRNVEKTFDAQ
jgi:hypothetical protein